MRISLLISNSYHVEFYKELVNKLKGEHEILLLVKSNETAIDLLDSYDFNYLEYGSVFEGYLPKILYSAKNKIDLTGRLLKFRPDVLLCVNELPPAPFNSIFNIPSIVFLDRLLESKTQKFVFNYADKILTPDCYHYDVPGKKHVSYCSYPSMLYLHQDRFEQDTEILEKLGVEDEEYVMVSFAEEDRISRKEKNTLLLRREKIDIVRALDKHCKVFLDDRGSYPETLTEYVPDISLDKYKDLLAGARFLVTDNSYTAVDAGTLGTPWIYVSPRSTPCLEEQEIIYEIGSRVESVEEAVDLFEMLINEEIEPDFETSYEKILEEKTDPIDHIVKEIEDFE